MVLKLYRWGKEVREGQAEEQRVSPGSYVWWAYECRATFISSWTRNGCRSGPVYWPQRTAQSSGLPALGPEPVLGAGEVLRPPALRTGLGMWLSGMRGLTDRLQSLEAAG